MIKFRIATKTNDILVLTAQGIEKSFNIQEEDLELKELVGEDYKSLLKELDGKKTVLELAKFSSINISNIQLLLTLMMTKGYIKNISEEERTVTILERLYNLIHDELLKEEKSISKILKETLDKQQNFIPNLINYSLAEISFDLIRNYLEIRRISSSELYETLLQPLSLIFDALDELKGNVYTAVLISKVFSELNYYYGSRIIDFMNNYDE